LERIRGKSAIGFAHFLNKSIYVPDYKLITSLTT